MTGVRRWAVLVLIFLVAGSCSSGSDAAGAFELEERDAIGPDPFVSDLAQPAPQELLDALDSIRSDVSGHDVPDELAEATAAAAEAMRADRTAAAIAAAAEQGLEVSAPASPQGVGLYGGSGTNACDVDGMVAFFDANPDHRRAWATVQGIEPDGVTAYLTSLKPGWLLDDADVVNHGFNDGVATPRLSSLEAGTAVLVDDLGIPRARCLCGNPLLPPPLSSTAMSTFESGNEGWTVVGDAVPSHDAAGGSLQASDLGHGVYWYWSAPAHFLAPVQSWTRETELQFSLQQTPVGQQRRADVILGGSAITVYTALPELPGETFTPYSLLFDGATEWRVAEIVDIPSFTPRADDPVATPEQLDSVLATLHGLYIRGEYRVGGDTGGLDDVSMTTLG